MNNLYKYDKVISFLVKLKKTQSGGANNGNDITTYYKDFPELIALLDKYNINGYVNKKTDVISKAQVGVIADLLIQKLEDKKIEKQKLEDKKIEKQKKEVEIKNVPMSETKTMSPQPLLSVTSTLGLAHGMGTGIVMTPMRVAETPTIPADRKIRQPTNVKLLPIVTNKNQQRPTGKTSSSLANKIPISHSTPPFIKGDKIKND